MTLFHIRIDMPDHTRGLDVEISYDFAIVDDSREHALQRVHEWFRCGGRKEEEIRTYPYSPRYTRVTEGADFLLCRVVQHPE